jgi:hypothetical protein
MSDLTLQEFRLELDSADVSLIGVDGPGLAAVEAAYELASVAQVLVASADMFSGGWNYEDVFERWQGSPSLSPEDLGGMLVRSYAEAHGAEQFDTIVALDLRRADPVREALNEWGESLMQHPDAAGVLAKTVSFAIQDDLYDLADFANRLGAKETQDELRSALDAFAIDTFWTPGYAEVHPDTAMLGISVFAPTPGSLHFDDYTPARYSILWPAGGWWAFARTLFGAT